MDDSRRVSYLTAISVPLLAQKVISSPVSLSKYSYVAKTVFRGPRSENQPHRIAGRQLLSAWRHDCGDDSAVSGRLIRIFGFGQGIRFRRERFHR